MASTIEQPNVIQNATVNSDKVTAGYVYYVKEGHLVTVTGVFNITSVSSGDVLATGLPISVLHVNLGFSYALNNNTANSEGKLYMDGSTGELKASSIVPNNSSLRFAFSYVAE